MEVLQPPSEPVLGLLGELHRYVGHVAINLAMRNRLQAAVVSSAHSWLRATPH